MPHPREFDHQVLPRSRELDKKIARVAGIRSLKKFPRGCPGVCTQLELTETLQGMIYNITKIYSNSGYIRHYGPGNLLLYCDNIVNGSMRATQEQLQNDTVKIMAVLVLGVTIYREDKPHIEVLTRPQLKVNHGQDTT